ncbi:MAG: ribosome recycling factor [Bacilli bacterium]|nr:ribosome recycling factor [Bacilli bacterium]
MFDQVLSKLKKNMDSSIDAFEKRLASVRAGRANPSSLDGVQVEYYGNLTPLKSLATISVPEARILMIKPFDKSCLADIEKAIFESNLGYTPNNDGETIRIVIPELTEERRRELTKQVKALAEDAKVSIRNNRHEALDAAKKMDADEDSEKRFEKDVQEEVNKYNKIVEEKLKEKEQDLLNI